MGSPKLARHYSFSKRAEMDEAGRRHTFYKNFFPIGVYGADIDNLPEIKRLAVNTVIIGGEGEKLEKTIEKCHEVGLRYVLSVPRDPDRLKVYLEAADFFMMDQYPVPNMPMTWLSDLIDRASAIAGNERITTVIQAFGGEAYETSGWPRRPAWREMDCLSFLSVVHGSRGIFFLHSAISAGLKKGEKT